jgi:hypothetical protein
MITYAIINSRISDVNVMDEDLVLHDIEQIIEQFDLTITQKTTLSTLKGSIHYHLKSEKSPGLLEVTYWPKQKRLWVEIHNNRKEKWNEEMIKPFSESLAHHFQGQVEIRVE